MQFVTFEPRPDVLPGQVIRVPLDADLLGGEELKDYQKAKIEARKLAVGSESPAWKNCAPRRWRDVAILCPRKALAPHDGDRIAHASVCR